VPVVLLHIGDDYYIIFSVATGLFIYVSDFTAILLNKSLFQETMHMKALVLKEYKKLVYEDIPQPQINKDEVLIRVKACSICGSDVHGLDGSTGRRIPPVVMGHEAAGIIEETGADVKGFNTGDRVTFDSTIYCGKCHYCRSGRVNLCDNRRVLGVSCEDYRQNGAFAEYVAVPQHILYRLPEDVSFEKAAMVEPLSIALHAVNITQISLNDTAVVVGSGMIGLLVIQVLKSAGCGRVIAVDVDRNKLDLALKLGADVGLKSDEADVTREVLKLTGNRGADIAIEAVGISAALKTALFSLRKGGALTLIGNLSPSVELPLQTVVTKEITIKGSCASSGEYDTCLQLISRKAVNVDALISKTAPLSEGAQWFERLYNREAGLMKVILMP
jgi:L-iditol 2-dehydrogenase